jgi:hypothetical protein
MTLFPSAADSLFIKMLPTSWNNTPEDKTEKDLEKHVAWDPEKQLVIGDSDANALLRQEYRAPYTHPEA